MVNLHPCLVECDQWFLDILHKFLFRNLKNCKKKNVLTNCEVCEVNKEQIIYNIFTDGLRFFNSLK